MSNLTKYINNLKTEFDKASFDILKDCSDEETLLCLFAYYHYFNADNSSISDIVQGNIYKWDAMDRIAGVYIDQESDFNDLDILSIKFTDNADFDFPAILKVFKDIESILFNFKDDIHIRKAVKEILSYEENRITPSRPVKIRIITNYDPKTI